MHLEVLFDPLLPWLAILVLAAIAAVLLTRGLLVRHPGVILRLLVLLVLLGAIANPSLKQEIREYHDDIVLVLEDRSASMEIGERTAEAEFAVAELKKGIEALGDIEIKEAVFRNGRDAEDSSIFTALSEALADLDRSRLAGVVLTTDGQIHDAPSQTDFPVPLHALIAGEREGFDRRVVLDQVPAFAVVGEYAQLSASIEDTGFFPHPVAAPTMSFSVNGSQPIDVPLSGLRDLQLGPISRGRNIIVYSTPPVAGETTVRNNVATAVINGVRDRLRVLLVSGFPHAGQRTWRNILKSDDSIELVHFTILRSQGDQDSASAGELSLIPFPVNELFLEKIDTFDLIIFDRYVLKGFLPPVYFHYINNYVAAGGAMLISAGPEFAGTQSIHATALADILPGRPTGAVLESGFRPKLTPVGFRHPVTAGLPGAGKPNGGEGAEPEWGRWFRQIEISPTSGHNLLEGVKDSGPLLLLDRVGQGRIALLASDQAWLWHRGVEGGGPQLELLRRLVHWLMKEPELEEEALSINVEGNRLSIVRRSIEDSVPEIEVIGPEGAAVSIEGSLLSPGRYLAESGAIEPGLYRVSDGKNVRLAGAGPEHPAEFSSTVATDSVLRAPVEQSGGGLHWIRNGVPEVRRVSEGRAASGNNWIGLTERNAYRTASVEIVPLLPGFLVMLLTVLGAAAAWYREGGAIRA